MKNIFSKDTTCFLIPGDQINNVLAPKSRRCADFKLMFRCKNFGKVLPAKNKTNCSVHEDEWMIVYLYKNRKSDGSWRCRRFSSSCRSNYLFRLTKVGNMCWLLKIQTIFQLMKMIKLLLRITNVKYWRLKVQTYKRFPSSGRLINWDFGSQKSKN